MKIFYFIFLIVGNLQQKYILAANSHFDKNLENVFDNNSGVIHYLNNNRNTKISNVHDSLNKDFDTKYANLFKNRLNGEDNENGRYDYQIDDGNPDIHSRIERPCQVYDNLCIRKFFAEHSRCKISGRPVPEPLYRAQATANYANANLTAIQLNVEYRGLSNARVEEFYINKATDNLLITLNFPSVTNFSNETILKFYRRGREPILTKDFGGFTTLSYSVTVIIPNLKDLRLDKAEITTYMIVPILPFIIGPRVAASSDPEVATMLAAFLANVPVDQREAGLTESNFYAATFIQYNICDFGLKVL